MAMPNNPGDEKDLDLEGQLQSLNKPPVKTIQVCMSFVV